MSVLVSLAELDNDSIAISAAHTLRKIAQKTENQLYLASAYRAMGMIENRKKNLSKTVKYFDSAQVIFNEFERIDEAMAVEYKKAKAYYYSSDNKIAASSFNTVLSYQRLNFDTSGIINTTAWLSMCSDQDIKKSIRYSEEGYELSKLIGDKESAMMCGNNLGIAFKDLGRPAVALDYYREVLIIAEEEGMDLYKAFFLENMGVLSSNMGNYREALEYYFEAMEIYEAENDLDILNELQINVGVIYKKNQEYSKALTAYRKYLKVHLKNGDSTDIVKAYLNIGTVFIEQKQFDSAKFYLQRAYKIKKRINSKCFGEAAASLGDLYYQEGMLDSALFLFESAFNSVEECDYNKILPAVSYGIGAIYNDLNDSKNAFKYFSKSYSTAVESGAKLEVQRAAEALYKWHKRAGNSNQAIKYLEVFKETTDSLFNQENTRELAWLEANYQMEKVADSLTQVKENEAIIFNRTIEDQKRRQTMTVIVSVAFILILVAIYLYVRKRKALKYQLVVANERDAGFKAVITATEEERKRIAKDLHDGVVQQIAAIKLTLVSVEKKIPEKERVEIVKAKNMADAAAEETRNLSHQMMPKVLMEVGLVAAMEEVINNLLLVNQVEVDFQQHGLKDRYENRIEIAIYRIFQELVNNIIKHSNAKRADIQLMENTGKLMLIVEDDGIGMKGEKKEGIGLSNIQSRLTTIDGKVNYESGPSTGTVATIVIPL